MHSENKYVNTSAVSNILITFSVSHRYPTYVARIQLAAIDYQKHKDRSYKRDAAGEIMWVFHIQDNKITVCDHNN